MRGGPKRSRPRRRDVNDGERGSGPAGRNKNDPVSDQASEDSIQFTVLSDQTERLDRFLADQFENSRTLAPRLGADKIVRVSGQTALASRLLWRGGGGAGYPPPP